MAVYNLGSINLDYFYNVPHLPQAGETLASTRFHQGLAAKGKSVNRACQRRRKRYPYRANPSLYDNHIALMRDVGVDTSHIAKGDTPTGHAIVIIEDKTAENQILLMQGANITITPQMIDNALVDAGPNDWALTQNKTNLGAEFLKQAKERAVRFVIQPPLS